MRMRSSANACERDETAVRQLAGVTSASLPLDDEHCFLRRRLRPVELQVAELPPDRTADAHTLDDLLRAAVTGRAVRWVIAKGAVAKASSASGARGHRRRGRRTNPRLRPASGPCTSGRSGTPLSPIKRPSIAISIGREVGESPIWTRSRRHIENAARPLVHDTITLWLTFEDAAGPGRKRYFGTCVASFVTNTRSKYEYVSQPRKRIVCVPGPSRKTLAFWLYRLGDPPLAARPVTRVHCQ